MTKIWNWLWRGVALCVIWCLRSFCELRGRVRIIKRPDQHEAYLIRYAIMGWLPGDKSRPTWLPNIYLHNIRLPDVDRALHNHPWPWAVSLILRGGYVELRKGAQAYWRLAGGFNVLRTPKDFHRIVAVYQNVTYGERAEGCWTLFVTSGKHSSWGFDVPGEGYVPHTVRAMTGLSDHRQGQISRIQKAMIDTMRELNLREGFDPNDGSGYESSKAGAYYNKWQPVLDSGRLPANHPKLDWGYTAREKREIIDVDFEEIETRALRAQSADAAQMSDERVIALMQDSSPEAIADLLGIK